MDNKLLLAVQYCQKQVDNKSIYVWGAEGQLGSSVTTTWIRNAESSCASKTDSNGMSYADIAVSMFEARKFSGNTVFRLFDCSGLIDAAFREAGIISASTKRTDCDGLWAKCNRLASPVDGCLLFRVSSSNGDDETHVGLYYQGYAYHAKGRANGVVKEKYSASYWHKAGWWRALQTASATISSPASTSSDSEADDITPPYVLIVGGSVYVREEPLRETDAAARAAEKKRVKKLYVARRGDKLPFMEQDADSGWYGVQCPKGNGFITNDSSNTRLVTE